MAASAMLIAKRVAALNKLRPSAVPALSRSFAASTSVATSPGSEEGSVDVHRRHDAAPVPRRHRSGDLFPTFGDALDPFNPRRSLMDVFNLVDQMLDFPFGAGRGTAGGAWRGWDAREDDKALYLKVEMPGLGKDDVQVMVENNTLAIKGEASENEGEEVGEVQQGGDEGRERGRRRYSSRIELPANVYELEGIKAEMRNGVLQVVVPKVKQEERKGGRRVVVE